MTLEAVGPPLLGNVIPPLEDLDPLGFAGVGTVPAARCATLSFEGASLLDSFQWPPSIETTDCRR